MQKAFLPEIGFRQAGVRLARPISLERDGRTLTVRQLVCTPKGIDLVYDFTNLPDDERTPMGQAPDRETVTLLDGPKEHRTSPTQFSMGVRTGKIERSMTLQVDPPLPTDVRGLGLRLDGATVGAWSLFLDLVPFPSGADDEYVGLDASDEREGITLTLRGIALSGETTAVELEASMAAPATRINGVGGLHGLRDGTTALVLRDQTGRTYPERARPDARDQFPGPRWVGAIALFDRLADDARELEIEVPYVCVDESGVQGDVDLPVTTAVDLTVGTYPIRVLSTREADSTAPWNRGPALAVDLDLGGWHGDRRILTLAGVSVDGAQCGCSFGRGIHGPEPEPVTYIEIPLKDPLAARRLTLRGATVQVRGPWRIRFDRP